MATNNRNMHCCEQCFHLGPSQDSQGDDAEQFSSASNEDASDRLARTVPAVQLVRHIL
jgi:hypothetical protein